MARSQYKFNPEDLNYDKLDDSLRARIWRIVIYVAAIVVIAVLLNVIYSLFFDTPRERQIRSENELLLDQYETLSKRKQVVDTVMQEVKRIDKDIYRVIFDTEPVQAGENSDVGLTYKNLLHTSDEKIVNSTAHKLDSLIGRDDLTAPLYDVLMVKGTNRSEMLPAICYLPADDITDTLSVNILLIFFSMTLPSSRPSSVRTISPKTTFGAAD